MSPATAVTGNAASGFGGCREVEQRQAGDRLVAQPAVARQAGGDLAAKEAAAAQN